MRLDSDLRVLAVTKYALVLFGSAHWFGCIWWAVARFSGFGDTCWVTQYYRLVGKAIDENTFRSSSYNYLLSLYWGFTVMTGVLQEGYAPDSTQETILCIISTFCQVLVFSFLLGILLHYVRTDRLSVACVSPWLALPSRLAHASIFSLFPPSITTDRQEGRQSGEVQHAHG